ncbi:unnamed protein product [Rhizoctonia solani]|uniref:CST complex subunit STN1 n=1 Tax=Rhizoctonia solani TaxID=456999 RepID=A0A8H3C9Y7_9AGAM|nr:unnamed protein product [Rhizoctonia solani]CAE6515609.1 unnamed protein product [Rhizoctonia solani]
MSTEDKPPAQNTLTVDEVRSYILRADATAPCSVADIHAVPEALKDLDIYWLGSVPCRTVHIVGLLVETVEYESRSIYLVDDGTASVNCLKKRPVRMTIEELGEGSLFHKSRGFEVGDTVSVIGKIEFYKKGRQVYVSSIEKCASSNAEPQHLLHVLEQHRNVYSRPFTIPPLPAVPSTPKKAARDNSQPSYASSMASSPITVTCSSPVVSPKKDKHRLRHPSRLRSKDLNENVFRMYLSHIIISTLPIPEYTSQDTSSLEPMLENVGSSTPRYSQTIAVTGSPTQTPTRPSRPPMDSIGSPTPRKPAGSLSTETSTTPTLGVTLSYLRRVQVLSDLARRVVDHVAHERDKAMRHAERSARAKYEASQLKTSERVVASSINASSEPRASKTGISSGSRSQPSHKISLLKDRSNASTKSLPSQRSNTDQSRSVSNSAGVSSSNGSRSSSRVKHPVAITPEETARRAAYHAKLSKLQDEDKKKRPARTKRLFEAALRTLVSEGELTLFDGPRRQVPSFSGLSERAALTPSGIWHDMTNTTTSSTMSTASTALNAPSCFDLETISEDDGHSTEILSDPSDSEDAYVPLTPQVLRPVMLAALRRSLLTQRGGVDLKSWTKALRSDGQWARIPDLVVKETIDTLREEEWISRVGPDRWDFTRGSWARSLKLS